MSLARKPRTGDVLLMVGTVKGAFIFHADSSRREFHAAGPHFRGHQVYSMAYLADPPRILAGNKSEHWGALVSWSDDFGATWQEPTDGNVKFPKGSGVSLNAVWALEPASAVGPDVVYAGADPAALFRSDDRGETFHLNDALFNHPERPKWNPGAGGLCLHSIVIDPQDPKRMFIAISSGGIYLSEDGGETWNARINGLRVHPDVPGATLCPHKLRMDPQNRSRLYLQSHPGMYRTDNDGRSWISIEQGLPSEFGFPLVTHPRQGGTVFLFPLTSDEFRVPPEGAPRVWRTRDGGMTWDALGKGLPSTNAYFTVLRDAFVCDTLEPIGLYFGTRGGQLFASFDEAENWQMLAEWLPPVLCVKAAVVA
jgi:hypothetical protein